MESHSLSELQLRVGRLDRQLRALRTVLCVLCAASAVLAIGAAQQAQQPKSIDVQEVRVLGPDRKPRIVMGTNPDSLPNLSFLDGDGKKRLVLAQSQEGPGLSLFGTVEGSSAQLHVGPSDAASFVMSEPSGMSLVVDVSGRPDRVGQIAVGDKGGGVRVAKQGSDAVVTLLGADRERLTLDANGGRESGLAVLDAKGRERLTIRVDAQGSPGLAITGEKGDVLFKKP
jgi:hypothetical protein